MQVIAYTYEADYHCINCAVSRFGENILEDDDNTEDGEGNLVWPIFSTDVSEILYHQDTLCCGDCFEVIAE